MEQLDSTHQRMMEEQPILPLLARFAGPAMVGMIASALYNIVDRIFVGQNVGAVGIAAIALCFPAMLFVFSVALLIGVGGSSRIAILLGEGNKEEAEKVLGNCFLLCVVASVFFLWFGQLFITPILRLTGASEALLPMAKSYLSIVLWGVAFAIFSFALSTFIRAAGSPNYAMGTQIVGAVSNVFLDALLVWKYSMGVEGAAIATVISQGISMLWVLGYFFKKDAKMNLKKKYIFNPQSALIGKVLAVGFPPFMVEMNFVLVHALMNSGVARDGGDLAVSATGIFMSVDSLAFMPAIAIGEGAQPIIGYNYGGGRIGRVIETIRLAVISTTIFYVLSFLVIQFKAEALVHFFNRTDQELITLAARAMRIANFGIPVMGISIITSFTIQGLGMAREGLILSVVRFGFLLILPLIVLPKFFGLYGNWAAFIVSDIGGTMVAGTFLYCLVKRLRREEHALDPTALKEH